MLSFFQYPWGGAHDAGLRISNNVRCEQNLGLFSILRLETC